MSIPATPTPTSRDAAEHPPWCSPEQCTVTPDGRGFHRSQCIEVSHPVTEMIWYVALSARVESFTWVDVIARYPDYGPDWLGEQVELGAYPQTARQLGEALIALADQAEGRSLRTAVAA